jgi:hypothetical protein
MGILENTLKGFLATLPGVVGSSVNVRATATVQSLATASAVVAASAAKASQTVAAAAAAASSSDGVTAKAVWVPKLPPQINVSGAWVFSDMMRQRQFLYAALDGWY